MAIAAIAPIIAAVGREWLGGNTSAFALCVLLPELGGRTSVKDPEILDGTSVVVLVFEERLAGEERDSETLEDVSSLVRLVEITVLIIGVDDSVEEFVDTTMK